MEETRKVNIELYSGVRINNNHELIELKYIPDIWELGHSQQQGRRERCFRDNSAFNLFWLS